jgi:hypothetical protein
MPDAFDILFPDGQDNAPGLPLDIFWNFRGNIDTWPTLPAAPATAAEQVTLSGAFTVTGAAYFKTIRLVSETGMIEHENVAGNDGGQLKSVLKGRIAGEADEVEAFIRQTRNSDLVLAVPQINGITRVMGSKEIPAKLRVVTGGSKNVGAQDGPGYDVEIVVFGVVCPKYTGAVPLSA